MRKIIVASIIIFISLSNTGCDTVPSKTLDPTATATPTGIQSPKLSSEGVKNIDTNGRTVKLVKESKHFHFSCSEMDEEFLTDMDKALEYDYERVCKAFQYKLNEKKTIFESGIKYMVGTDMAYFIGAMRPPEGIYD